MSSPSRVYVRVSTSHDTAHPPVRLPSDIRHHTISYSPPDEAGATAVSDSASPYTVVALPSEAVARALQARCVMADRVVELWGHGGSGCVVSMCVEWLSHRSACRPTPLPQLSIPPLAPTQNKLAYPRHTRQSTHTPGADYSALIESLGQLSPEFTGPYLAADRSWSLVVEGTRRTLTMAEQDTARWKVVKVLPFAGRIQLKAPDDRYWLSEDYAHPKDAAPRHVYFGRELPGCVRARELVGLGDLKRRAYLGPTSLDNEVALLMASFAFVRPGAVVLDPFVGTGSILIACAQLKAQLCVGTDIDIRVLRGKKGRNVFSNFAQYNLPPPELVRSDNALHQDDRGGHYGHFRALPTPFYDAVVCDPPYGIRAGARRSGSRREEVKPIPDHLRADHIPQTRPYPVVRSLFVGARTGMGWEYWGGEYHVFSFLSPRAKPHNPTSIPPIQRSPQNDVMQDLLAMSAAVLKPRGRLVYLLPVDLSPDAPPPPDPLIPEHPAMELVCVVDQALNSKLIRKMVVMRRREQEGDGEGAGELTREPEQKRHCA